MSKLISIAMVVALLCLAGIVALQVMECRLLQVF